MWDTKVDVSEVENVVLVERVAVFSIFWAFHEGEVS